MGLCRCELLWNFSCCRRGKLTKCFRTCLPSIEFRVDEERVEKGHDLSWLHRVMLTESESVVLLPYGDLGTDAYGVVVLLAFPSFYR